MIERIFHDLYRIEIPLPDSPLKSVNAYLIIGGPRHLLVDTGFNRKECREALCAALSGLNVSVRNIDFFVTHLHADHCGLVMDLAQNGNRVFFNRPDAEYLLSWSGFDAMIDYAEKNGFTKGVLREVLESHPAADFDKSRLPELTILESGQALMVGGYRFECIATPGHTRGHMCLYEPNQRLFLSGDHILQDITPHIQCWRDEWNPLKDYLESLQKVRGLAVDRVLPGHRRVFGDFRPRIDEILEHHRIRSKEILSILDQGPKNAYQIAPEMTWDIRAESWSRFPTLQQWFATGEVIAHLKYLCAEGIVSRETAGNIFIYSKREG